MKKGKDGFYCRYVKRIVDVICALLAMVVFFWLYAIIAILVLIKLGSPVIFKQKRPGKGEKIFTMYKFRTMTGERDVNGELLPDNIRLTEFGKRLRATSLDELPEALNILKGDMSLIGPRPQLFSDLLFMTLEQRQRHCVRPGLSGWAQINGRNCIEWEDKLNFDLEYLDKVSIWMDVKIVVTTIIKVFKAENISYNGAATAEDFGDYLLRTGKISSEECSKGQKQAKELLRER
ncbi:MAG TPA: sugar transferase [Clostridia bacterium]|nr:sugar transferase [Clostridia bacterium]